MNTIEVNEAIALVKNDDIGDWYTIERAVHDHRDWMVPSKYGMSYQHSGRISDADVEGPGADMRGIAAAITARGEYHAKRCAVRVAGDRAFFCSPRNSRADASVPLAIADALAAQITQDIPAESVAQ